MYSHSRLNLEPHHILVALADESLHFLLGQSERVAHLHTCVGVILEVLDFPAFCLQFLGRVECDVCLAGIKQLVNILFIYVAAFALSVWPVVSSEGNTLVEFYAEPLE